MSGAESGIFSGYASLFGAIDLAGDQMLPGAFQKTLARRGAAEIKLLYQHDAAEPIGRWLEIREDAKGLYVLGRIQTDIQRGAEVLSLIRAQILDGLSIGFRTVTARTDRKSGIRRVSEVELWEISVVTFPMLPGARIASPETRCGMAAEQALAWRMRETAQRLLARA